MGKHDYWLIPIWLLFRPSRWLEALESIDPALDAHASLSDLRARHWRNATLQRFLFGGLVILPVAAGAGTTIVLHAANLLDTHVGFGLWLGVLWGVMIAATTAIVAGISLGMVATLLLCLIFGHADFLAIDLLIGPSLGILLGAVGGISVYALLACTPREHIQSADLEPELPEVDESEPGAAEKSVPLLVRYRYITLALGAALVIILFSVLGSSTLAQTWEAGGLHGPFLSLMIGAIPALVVMPALFWRTRSLGVSLAWSALVCFFFGTAHAAVFVPTRYQFAYDPAGKTLVLAFLFAPIAFYSILFIGPYNLLRSVTGPALAAAIPGLCTLVASWGTGVVIDALDVRKNTLWAAGLLALTATMVWWRPVVSFLPSMLWDQLLFRLDNERRDGSPRLRSQTAFWDELQWLHLRWLDDHLLLALEREPLVGQQALETIAQSRQVWAARAAQLEYFARRLLRCRTLEEVAEQGRALPESYNRRLGPSVAILTDFRRISLDIGAALGQRSSYNQRLMLGRIAEELIVLSTTLLVAQDRYANRCQSIALRWHAIVVQAAEAVTAVSIAKRELPNPYIAGAPLRDRQLFVGRREAVAQLEARLRDEHSSPLLLHGQRRMGKTSLLYQLRWLLPSWVLPLQVDLQGAVSLSMNHAGFVKGLTKKLGRQLQQMSIDTPSASSVKIEADPFWYWDDWLDALEAVAQREKRKMILIALDEFETLDIAFRQGHLSPDAVLGALRNLIQHRPLFRLLLAGSHTLEQFRHWSGFLINVQVVGISFLSKQDSRQLVEQPIDEFELAYAPDATDLILDLTCCHPYLLQLLCKSIVDRKNSGPLIQRTLVSVGDVEAVLPDVFLNGVMFFDEIAYQQLSPSERSMLAEIARVKAPAWMPRDEAFSIIEDPIVAARCFSELKRRGLVELGGEGVRIQVELLRRWLVSEHFESR